MLDTRFPPVLPGTMGNHPIVGSAAYTLIRVSRARRARNVEIVRIARIAAALGATAV